MKNILVDTILYNPTTYIYNISKDGAMVYDVVTDKIYRGTFVDGYLSVKPTHDKRLRWHYKLEYMFDVSEITRLV